MNIEGMVLLNLWEIQHFPALWALKCPDTEKLKLDSFQVPK